MYAKVTKEFPGKPDNEVVSRLIVEGEIISGDLAKVAIDNEWAKEVPPNTKAATEAEDSPLTQELKGKTVDELRAYAAEKNVDLGAVKAKAAIVAVLVDALDKPEADAPAE